MSRARKKLVAAVVGLLAVLAAGLWAIELKETEPGRERPERILPPPPPPPENPLVEAIRTIDVGEPIWCRGLGIFPLIQRRVTDDRPYLTLDEALKRADLDISEVGGGSVPKVVVRNRSKHYVFLLANEVLAGGMQNRMLREDLLLRPHSEEVVVEVFCVERGRWSNPDQQFRRSDQLAQQRMRRRVAERADQAEVWEEVERFSREYGVSSRTDDLAALQADRKVAEELAEYERVIIPKLPRETVGLVATRGPFILGADIFCNEELFRKLRWKIIQSYALTRIDEPHIAIVLDRRDVEDFLRRAYHTHYSDREAPDVGERVRIEGAGLTGMGFSFQGNLIHAALFPQPEVVPLPMPEPRPRPLLPRRPPVWQE